MGQHSQTRKHSQIRKHSQTRKHSFRRNKNIPKFANKTYIIKVPGSKNIMWGYTFSKNGDKFDLIGFNDGKKNTYIKNIPLFKNKNTYFTPMVFNKTSVIHRYVHTGMQFNKSFTKIYTSTKEGGPYFQLAKETLFAKTWHENYDKYNHQCIKHLINNNKLLYLPDNYPTIFELL